MLIAGRSGPLTRHHQARAWLSQRQHALVVAAAAGKAHSASNTSVHGSPQQPCQVVVVGGGAAGLTAAYFAAKAGAKVLVLERMQEAGKKILMSGGTRCNVLPLHVDVDSDFFTESSRSALRAVFASWSLEQCRHWLEHDIGLPLAVEEATNKLFPRTNSARDVRDAMLRACAGAGVEVRYGASLEGLEAQQQLPQQQLQEEQLQRELPDDGDCASSRSADTGHSSSTCSSHRNGSGVSQPAAIITTSSSSSSSSGHHSRESESTAQSTAPEPDGSLSHNVWLCHLRGTPEPVRAQRVVLATGGMSFPAVGTDGTGHAILRSLGVQMVGTYAALTPLTGRHPGGEQLPGVSLDSVAVECTGIKSSTGKRQAAKRATARRTGFLCTHKGFSGPSILDVSHYVAQAHERQLGEQPVVRVSWTGDSRQEWEARLQQAPGSMLVRTVLQTRRHQGAPGECTVR